ncbi:hypothetical protein [Amycolatopsis sp. NPDC051903]|uniref:hypothetical protein n=1 Tax=Amycolatopsis sp. NPDC051903 TaxID=3363936 RepID=UPI00379D5DEE
MTAVRRRGCEFRTLTGLLAGAREGRGDALVLRGEPGIGETALISAALARPDVFGDEGGRG